MTYHAYRALIADVLHKLRLWYGDGKRQAGTTDYAQLGFELGWANLFFVSYLAFLFFDLAVLPSTHRKRLALSPSAACHLRWVGRLPNTKGMQPYIPAVRRWGRSDALLISFRGLEDTVSTSSNTVSVPYEFVQRAGFAEAALLEEIAQQCVNEEGDLLASNGQPAKTVAAGEQFVFAPADDDGFTWAQGPEGKSAALQQGSDDSENTSSSEVDQVSTHRCQLDSSLAAHIDASLILVADQTPSPESISK